MILTFTLLQAADIDEFRSQISRASSDKEGLAVVQEFLPKLSGVDELRELQNQWQRLDPQACTAYFNDAAQKSPLNPTYKYLSLRFAEDRDKQLEGGRSLCKQHPEFYWGYRLFIVNLTERLLNNEKEAKKPWVDNPIDVALIEQGLKRFPADDYLNLYQFHRYRIAKDYYRAQTSLDKVKDLTAISNNWHLISNYIADSRRIDVFSKLFPQMLSVAIAQGELSSGDSLSIYQQQYLSVLDQMQDWDAMSAFFKANPQLKDSEDLGYLYNKLLIAQKDYPQVLERLNQAFKLGTIDFQLMQNTPYFEPLSEQKGWNELLANAKAKWDADEPARIREALKDRLNTPAPMWELKDKNGKTVKLADYKGQIVVLDFWATWCGPCRSAMPALDKWMKEKMPQGVQVFSINVWEKADEKAIKYFNDNAFAMTLLFGVDTLAKDYNFDGIPYICVIDKQGKLAFSQSGYSPALEDNLSYWVQALTKE
jgi:thiol-disulfide isomerase/thioredoxin